jgi:methyltransferase-like protein/SAM-dependent methyltransferase
MSTNESNEGTVLSVPRANHAPNELKARVEPSPNGRTGITDAVSAKASSMKRDLATTLGKEQSLSSTNQRRSSYDEVPYKSYPYRQTHPDRLATVASLFGMKTAPIQNCRVLEIGCASGGNLLPMAVHLPGSKFVGIDASAVEIADGQKAVESLGLSNVELLQKNILEIGPEFGQFDYIISHGVYSWVPDEVQTKLLEICARNLSPNGVAYVSYNTYPGWRMRGMIRDMMVYRSRGAAKPADRLRQSRALLDFLSQSVPTEDNAYGILLRDEVNQMREKEDSYLLHDYLEEVNEPVYFYEFVELAEKQGLQYLGEADFRVMAVSNFPKHVEAMLQSVSSNLVEMEQYMDFLRNRMFRQTLLCHQGIPLDRSLSSANILAMHVASPARPETANIDVESKDQVKFRGPSSTLTTSEPLVKAAILHLGEIWPRSVPFSTLFAAARARLNPEPVVVDTGHVTADTQRLAEPLVRCYSTALVELSVQPSKFTSEVSATPCTSALARYQATTSNMVTNLRHEGVRLNDLQRHVVPYLDGQHDTEGLLDALLAKVRSGDLFVHERGAPVSDENRVREILKGSLDQCLNQIARMALLSGSQP